MTGGKTKFMLESALKWTEENPGKTIGVFSYEDDEQIFKVMTKEDLQEALREASQEPTTNLRAFLALANLYCEEAKTAGAPPNRIYSIKNWSYVEAYDELHYYHSTNEGEYTLHFAWKENLEPIVDTTALKEMIQEILEKHDVS